MQRLEINTPYRRVDRLLHRSPVQLLGVLIVVGLVTLVLFSLRLQLGDANISLLYLLVVLFYAATSDAKITIFCGAFSFVCYDYFLIPPFFDLTPHSPVKLLDPLAFLVVALVTGALAERSRKNAVAKQVYQEASQFRATILHLVSHNLRTPLATIKTAISSLMTNASLHTEERELLAAANQECDRLNRLIGNVLQISRLDANAVQLRKDWNGLDEVISSVFAHWKAAVNSDQLSAAIPSDLPLVYFDFDLIEGVLTNLVENAFRHGAAPVRVAVSVHPHEVRVSVEDSGSGVAPADRARLFQHFSTSKSAGLGLGLAVSKGLIDAHGGRIWADFEQNKTIFSFALPYSPETEDSEGDL